MKSILSVMVLSVGLAACQTITRTETIVNFQKIEIPSQFLDCKDKIVSVPDPKKLTNKQISQYILKLKALTDECQNDVSSIDVLIKEYNVEVEKINERLNNDKNK